LAGIIPAIESSHAVAHVLRMGRDGEKGCILVNLSGRGDKDIYFGVEYYASSCVVASAL